MPELPEFVRVHAGMPDSGTFDVFDKLDGHRLMLRRGEAYRRSAERNEWDYLPAHVQAAALDTWLDGELLVPGEQPTEVESALAGDRPERLQFRPFRIPGFRGGARAEHALLTRLGFQPPLYFGRFTAAEIAARWPEWAAQVDEGVVLRPVDGGAWRKLKRVESIDLPVVALTEGHGKYAGLVGALVCKLPNGDRVRVGAGLSDAERWRISRRDRGRVCEIAYQSRTDSGSLRSPRFVRWRDDLARIGV